MFFTSYYSHELGLGVALFSLIFQKKKKSLIHTYQFILFSGGKKKKDRPKLNSPVFGMTFLELFPSVLCLVSLHVPSWGIFPRSCAVPKLSWGYYWF